MIIQQFFTKKIAHSSYFLGGDKTCVNRSSRDAVIYIEVAERWVRELIISLKLICMPILYPGIWTCTENRSYYIWPQVCKLRF
jgi:hypothetical protein